MFQLIYLLIMLFSAHALCDYALQGTYVATHKNPWLFSDDEHRLHRVPIDLPPWWLIMSMHSLVHTGAVLIITGNLWCAGLEFVSHFVIDYFKCAKKLDFTTDQLLHLGMKVVYIAVLVIT